MPKVNQGRAANPRPKHKSSKKAVPKTRRVKEVNVVTAKVPNVLNISTASWLVIWKHRKTFSVITLIYGLAYLVLVLGLSSPANVSGLKAEFSSVFHGHLSTLYSGFNVYTYLVGSTTSASSASGSAYQVFIIIIASLSIIWTLRQVYQGTKIRARDSYYQGLYPLAQYILILLFIAVELIPLALGAGLYTLLLNGGIAVTILEKVLSIALVLGLVGFSLYLISSSVIALYIVTLPNMTPLKALRSAKGLVRGRRWSVFRKIIFLPFLLFVVTAIIMLPFIIILPAISAWLFFILTLIGLVYIHSYLYNLYRGLIDDESSG